MNNRVWLAASVHVLTASGAAIALLALIAAHRHDWQGMFAWLGLALIVDAVDGPLARMSDTVRNLPRWSGERLDLIVDFLTYVVVPAFALSETDILPEDWRLPAAIAIVVTSLFHFTDQESKTEEGYFVGFPALWNVAVFYLFVLAPPAHAALALVLILIVLTFVPILAPHPFRTRNRRIVNGAAALTWTIASALALFHPFPSPLWIQSVLLGSGAYLALEGMIAWWRSRT